MTRTRPISRTVKADVGNPQADVPIQSTPELSVMAPELVIGAEVESDSLFRANA